MVPKRVAKSLVEFEWYYRLRELVEVSSEDVGCIMYGVASPVQPFAIPVRRIECFSQLLDALF
jgi:hypothetical protein